ncbi:MAG: glycine cleavage system protein GcvH [Candidatus Methanomethylophilaceae archaeon]|jgi:glycine cleavage system H protein|nr:glycine cleavage system protein GcvH [Candidatus Methanomethylophilaceae archaeon]
MAKEIEVRDGLLYSRDHLWVVIEDGKARFGLTDYAQMEMGDLVYLELTEVGKDVDIDDEIGVMESVKTIDSIYAPVSGKVIESNPAVEKEPKLANQAPYDHWIGVIEMSAPSDVEALQDSAGYRKKV